MQMPISQKKGSNMLRSKEEISCLLDVAEDMLDRYMDRPDESFLNGRYGCVNLICYAEFLRYHFI